MASHTIIKLSKVNALEHLKTGETAVRVSLQYQPKLTETSREMRHILLIDKFKQLADALIQKGAEMDLSTLSVSGQTVEALISVDHLKEIKKSINEQMIGVNILMDRKIV